MLLFDVVRGSLCFVVACCLFVFCLFGGVRYVSFVVACCCLWYRCVLVVFCCRALLNIVCRCLLLCLFLFVGCM